MMRAMRGFLNGLERIRTGNFAVGCCVAEAANRCSTFAETSLVALATQVPRHIH